jgi:TonB family protein
VFVRWPLPYVAQVVPPCAGGDYAPSLRADALGQPYTMRLLLRSAAHVAMAFLPACGQYARTQSDMPPLNKPTSCAGHYAPDTLLPDSTRLTERPALREWDRPSRPSDPIANGVSGTVVLEFIVNTDGSVDPQSLRVARYLNPALDDAAEQAVLGASFWPGCLDSMPVRVLVSFPVTFWYSPTPQRHREVPP